MFDATAIPKLVTFMVAVLAFEIWERYRPSRRIDRRRDIALDLLAFGIVVVAGLIWPRVIGATFDSIDLHRALGVFDPLRALPGWLKILIGLGLADFTLYWVHRWMHGPDILWRAHQFHHSTEQLYWLSGARTSLFHLFLFALPQVLIAHYVLDVTAREAAIGFSIGVVINLWVHSNITVRLGPIEWLVVTPDFHRAHHARDLEPSKNIGFMLTIWDRLFGTYVDPHTLPKDYPLGLASGRAVGSRMIAGV